MKLVVTIDTSNAAFHDGNENDELSRLLTECSVFCMHYGTGAALQAHPKYLYDTNGNRVGQMEVTLE